MVYIVSEIGVNWNGDLQLLENMIKKSKEIGCNAIKFQAFNEQIVKDHPEKETLLKCSITKNNIESINRLAKNNDIEWFCSPMYPEAVDFIEPFVNYFKIREVDGRSLLNNKTTPLLEKVLATNKEIFVSTKDSPIKCDFYSNKKIKWLYCVPKYPCELEDLDFKNIKDFDGYSNHCPHFLAPLTAVILGTKIIEVHITSDKSKDFADNNVSFDYNELNNLIKQLKLIEKIKR